jgi:hypothetical protein
MLQASLETGAAPAAPIALAEWRLKLIEHHYPDALTERLGAIYPGVARLVGVRYFRAAGRRFATRNPPRTLAAADFGAGFSGFLSAQPAARLLPYLPDLARLEWAVHAARRAPRVPALPADALDRFRDDEYRRIALILHPSCQLVRSRHPVLDIYRATLPETDPLEFVAPSAEGVRLMLKATATRVASAWMRRSSALSRRCAADAPSPPPDLTTASIHTHRLRGWPRPARWSAMRCSARSGHSGALSKPYGNGISGLARRFLSSPARPPSNRGEPP